MEQYKGYNIKIEYDECSESPREWDNLGIMVAFHRNYDLGDKNHNIQKDSYYNDKLGDYVNCDSWEDIEKQILYAYPDAILVKPLYLYDHSGITISMSDYCDKWDSGQVGFYFTTRERIKKEFSCKRITKKVLDRVSDILKQEVKTYDQYLIGDVYYVDIQDKNGEDVECIGGFYGYEYALEESKSIIDADIEYKRKNNIKKLKEYITHNVPLEKRVLVN